VFLESSPEYYLTDMKYIHVILADMETFVLMVTGKMKFFVSMILHPKAKKIYCLYFKTGQRWINEVTHCLIFVMSINLAAIIIGHINDFFVLT